MKLYWKRTSTIFLLSQLVIIGISILLYLFFQKTEPQYKLNQNDIDAIKEELSASRELVADYLDFCPNGNLDPRYPNLVFMELGLNFALEGKSSDAELKSLLKPFIDHANLGEHQHRGSYGNYTPDSYACYFWANAERFIQIEAFSLSNDTTRIRYLEVLR